MLKPLSRLSLALAFVVAFTALFGANALAQPAAPDVYVVVTYIKTLPGQDAAYRDYLTTTGKKIFQEMMAAQPTLLYWSSARTMYQGMEHGSDFDYVGASVYAGPPPEPGTIPDAVYMKAAGMSQADLGKKLATMRTIVGHGGAAPAGGALDARGPEGRRLPRRRAQIRIKPGMGNEYYDTARTMAQPMMQARAAAGELKTWSVWSRVFPAGAGTSYDALSVTYFKDQASAIKGLDATKGIETFMKVHPGKNYATYINNLRDYSELQQRFIMQIIAMAERAR